MDGYSDWIPQKLLAYKRCWKRVRMVDGLYEGMGDNIVKLLNNPKSIIGRICWSWARKRRRIVSVKPDQWEGFIVHTVDDYGNPNQSSYDGYFWDKALTRPFTLQEVKQCWFKITHLRHTVWPMISVQTAKQSGGMLASLLYRPWIQSQFNFWGVDNGQRRTKTNRGIWKAVLLLCRCIVLCHRCVSTGNFDCNGGIVVKTRVYQTLNGTYVAEAMDARYPNTYAVGLTAKQAVYRLHQKIR